MNKLIAFAGSVIALVTAVALASPSAPDDSHTKWIAECLKEIETIKVGMTRNDLSAVFTIEGGISTRTQQTFVFRKCLYIKADVTFRVQDANDALAVDEKTDIITSISKPYLQWAVGD